MPTRWLDGTAATTWTTTNATDNLWTTWAGARPGITYTYGSPEVTQEDLDKLKHNLFKIITEHIALDINEEEFIKLLEE